MTITRPKVFGVEILFKSECVSYATCLQAKIDLLPNRATAVRLGPRLRRWRTEKCRWGHSTRSPNSLSHISNSSVATAQPNGHQKFIVAIFAELLMMHSNDLSKISPKFPGSGCVLNESYRFNCPHTLLLCQYN
jgi:hypothetical protein